MPYRRDRGRSIAAIQRDSDGTAIIPAGRPNYVHRFSRTERAFHWVNAAGFFLLLATGLILYLPRLSAEVGRRPLIKDIHFWGGLGWVAALAVVALLGDRRGLRQTAREIDVFAREDVNWLRRRTPSAQARFNAGQKLNAALNAAFLVLFLVWGCCCGPAEGHPVPVCEHRHPPRRADVRVARAAPRSPLSRLDPPDDAARVARDGDRRRARGLGAAASRALGHERVEVQRVWATRRAPRLPSSSPTNSVVVTE